MDETALLRSMDVFDSLLDVEELKVRDSIKLEHTTFLTHDCVFALGFKFGCQVACRVFHESDADATPGKPYTR